MRIERQALDFHGGVPAMHIERTARLAELRRQLRQFRVVGLLGARQVGKTTLAREVAAAFRGQTTHFDLERPEDVARLREPELALAPLRGLVVLDEIQRRPDLFPVLRGRRRLGFEFKRTTAPSLTPSMRSTLADLGLVSLTVVHAGQNSFPLAPNVRALAFRKLIAEVKPIG